MNKKIEKKIVGYKVVSEEQEAPKAEAVETPTDSNIIQMHEKVSRPGSCRQHIQDQNTNVRPCNVSYDQ